MKLGVRTKLDLLEAQKAKLAARDVSNYTCPKDREIAGWTTERYQTFMSKKSGNIRARWNDTFHGRVSPLKAIKTKCEECVGPERAAIIDCRGYSCPLYSYRPYQNKETSNEQD